MYFEPIRITSATAGYLLAGAIAVAASATMGTFGCAPSKAEVREASGAGYATDFAQVYSVALEAIRKRYPHYSENANAGVIKTSWHRVRISTTQEDPQSRRPTGNKLYRATARAPKEYYVRFTVRVLGGGKRPWRVEIAGQASLWDRAAATPAELKGADEPHWLKGRINGLRVAIHDRLKNFAIKIDTPQKKKKAVVAPKVDMDQFSNVPAAAAKAIAAALTATKARDFAALGATMNSKFTWSLGAPPSSQTAVAMWQADSTVLDELTTAMEAGCRADRDGARVTCPPEYSAQPGYTGYRVGFEPGRSGAWKMTFFVSGD